MARLDTTSGIPGMSSKKTFPKHDFEQHSHTFAQTDQKAQSVGQNHYEIVVLEHTLFAILHVLLKMSNTPMVVGFKCRK